MLNVTKRREKYLMQAKQLSFMKSLAWRNPIPTVSTFDYASAYDGATVAFIKCILSYY